jgi:GTP-binding protein Era
MSQQELLQELDSKLTYEGRILSKSNDGEEDIPHRCALVTIIGKPNMGKSTLLNAVLDDTLAITTNRPQTTRHAILGVMTSDYSQICLTDTPGIIEKAAYKLQEGMMDVVQGAVKTGDVFLVVTDAIESYNIIKDKNKDVEVEEEPEEDPFLGLGEDLVMKLRKYEKPVIVCVNKVDVVAEDKSSVYENTPLKAIQTIQKWRALLPDAFVILPTCAAAGPDDPGVTALRSILSANDPEVDVPAAIRGLGRPVPGMFRDKPMLSNDDAREILPIGPPLYDPDFFTDRTDRFCASELIRETLFERLGKELPYCCEVRIERFDESKRYLDEDGPEYDSADSKKKRKSLIRIEATILVERDSQKGIVVGKGGQQIKEVGTDARRKLEKLFGVKVRIFPFCFMFNTCFQAKDACQLFKKTQIFLELRVKVDKNWRNNADKLKQFGYMS